MLGFRFLQTCLCCKFFFFWTILIIEGLGHLKKNVLKNMYTFMLLWGCKKNLKPWHYWLHRKLHKPVDLPLFNHQMHIRAGCPAKQWSRLNLPFEPFSSGWISSFDFSYFCCGHPYLDLSFIWDYLSLVSSI